MTQWEIIMPLSKEHKKKSRSNILKSAIQLFSQKGFDRVSIDEVMREAGMTRGAFYAHFKSKEDLYIQAIFDGSEQSVIPKNYFESTRGLPFLIKLIDDYLSLDQLSDKSQPSPLAFLVTDVTNGNIKIRTAYTEIYTSLIKQLNRESSNENCNSNTDLLMAVTAMLVGGIAVSRALVDSDLTDRLLQSCRSTAQQLVAKG
jgi:AcrR family transcriptional regulator